MTHLATADTDPAFARVQIERFREATEPLSHLTRHVANSAAALRLPESRFDAARCGIALYGLSPFGDRSRRRRARAGALAGRARSRSRSCCARASRPATDGGSSPTRDTWIGIVPVGYADGFRRDLTGTEVLVAGERRRVVGAVSMDATAVELDRELPPGTPVTIVGHGRAAGGARARGGHDHLRARLPDQHLADARAPRGHRLMSANAERRAALQRERAAALAERLDQWLPLKRRRACARRGRRRRSVRLRDRTACS